jgi:LmbE family N-acetylglucosaminyl deacetylase
VTAARQTIVSFHAHPDDEVLLTGGTLARAAAAGHRVVLVTATNGGAGLADGASIGAGLGQVRTAELTRAAALLGCARVELLGYRDSGSDGRSGGAESFVRAAVPQAATRLADVLREEQADVLTVYDEHGGYGHPDHVQVHRVGLLAARLAGTPRVVEATVDRDLLRRGVGLMRLLRMGRGIEIPELADAYLPRDQITHRVDVRAFADVKRAAMSAHVSQAGSGSDDDRTLAMLLRLPQVVFRALLGHEWFAEHGVVPGRRLPSDLMPVQP